MILALANLGNARLAVGSKGPCSALSDGRRQWSDDVRIVFWYLGIIEIPKVTLYLVIVN